MSHKCDGAKQKFHAIVGQEINSAGQQFGQHRVAGNESNPRMLTLYSQGLRERLLLTYNGGLLPIYCKVPKTELLSRDLEEKSD